MVLSETHAKVYKDITKLRHKKDGPFHPASKGVSLFLEMPGTITIGLSVVWKVQDTLDIHSTLLYSVGVANPI